MTDLQVEIARANAEMAARKAARVCGGCTACCTILGIPTLGKPMMRRCAHECAAGCAVYERRPEECAEFLCLWREGWGTDAMRPDLCRFMLWTQEQPHVYRYAQGFVKVPATVVVAYESEANAFQTEPFQLVRRNLLRMGAVLMEFHDSTVRVYGVKYPDGQNIRAVPTDGDPTRMRLVIPGD